MNITAVCIKRPILAWVIMITVMLVGIMAARRIKISEQPEMNYPTVTVWAGLPGTGPEEIERSVTMVLEGALAGIEGVKHITSQSVQNRMHINLELGEQRNVDAVVQEVQQKIASVQYALPSAMHPPTVQKASTTDRPVMYLTLASTLGPRSLADLAHNRLKDALQGVPGVSSVQVWGLRQRQVRLWLDPGKLWAYRLTPQDVEAALAREHRSGGAGALVGPAGQVPLHVAGEAQTVAELAQLPIRGSHAAGAPIVRVADVATVEDGFSDENVRTRVDGMAGGAMLGIFKQRSANAVSVAHAIHAAVDTINKDLPSGTHLRVDFDLSKRTEEGLRDLAFELAVAIAVTAICCRLFLGNWQSTLNVVLAIPMSLLGACAALYACGFTLNLFTMLGLTVAVGIVVDDAIMVLESIDRQRRSHNDAAEAAAVGTQRIAFAALAATLGVVCIFAPVMFMQGYAGRRFLELGVALSAAVLLSYLEAVTLAPARCAQMMRRMSVHQAHVAGWEKLEQRFAHIVQACVTRPWRTLGATATLCAGGLLLLANIDSGSGAPSDQAEVWLQVEAPVNSSLQQTDALIAPFEAYCRAHPGVIQTLVQEGVDEGPHEAFITLVLAPPHQRQQTSEQISQQLYADLARFAPLKAVSFDQRAVQFNLRGSSWDGLRDASGQCVQQLHTSGLFRDVVVGLKAGPRRLVLRPQRQALADAGISTADLSQTVSTFFAGSNVGYFDLGGQRSEITMRLLGSARSSPEQLSEVMLRGTNNHWVPLSELTLRSEGATPTSLERMDRLRALRVDANLRDGVPFAAAKAAVEKCKAALPNDMHLEWLGSTQTAEESNAQLYLAMALGVAFAYLVLAAQFNSVWLPWVVLLALPLAASGAGLTLFVTHTPLGETAMIGLLLLFGLVKKNSIMLVDCAVTLRSEGLAPRQAAIEAAKVRLRPILMTTCATMLAVIPAALAWTPGGAERQAMAWVVLGGLLSSTALSLVVVPTVLGCAPSSPARRYLAQR